MKVLFLDAYNLMYRARYGFGKGEHSTIFSFFRSLRPLVEKFKPDQVYFVLEGYPKQRMALLPEYKANRVHEDKDDWRPLVYRISIILIEHHKSKKEQMK